VFRSTLICLALSASAFAQEAKTPWTDKIELYGDIRLRHDYLTKTKPTDTSDVHQERLRLRLGMSAKINDRLKAKVRIATSQGQNPLATNQTLTDNANKKGLYVDLAMVDYALAEGHSLWAGKMENPLRVLPASQLIYDVDYTPEGAAYQGQFGGIFVKGAAYIIQERAQQADGTSEPDSWLLAGLAGYKGEISESMGFMLAAGYHDFSSLKDNGALNPTPGFLGNSSYGPGRYKNDYKVGELLAEYHLKGDAHLISIFGDVLNNFDIDEENRAYLAGLTYQTLDDKGKANWTFGYAYTSLDKDATVSALNNSDFANGSDGSFGHIVQVGKALAPGTTLSLAWNNAHIDNGGRPFTSERALLDLVMAF
jgi:hypothetical protein